MRLTEAQTAAYERDGFLVFPELVSAAEVALLRQEVERLMHVDAEGTVREGSTGAPKSMFRLHEDNGAGASPAFRALSRTPRVLEGPALLAVVCHGALPVARAVRLRSPPGLRSCSFDGSHLN